ncbi:MAG: hypothetical protein WC806_03645 [Candidatus Gracilibacteria bacterium]|jgi:hypothetical protein
MTKHSPAKSFEVSAAPQTVTGPLSELVTALKFCRSAMSNEETRYYLKSVCLQMSDSGLRAVSTDGHRLHHIMVGKPTAKAPLPRGTFLLKRADVLAILKTYSAKGKQKDKTFSLTFGANSALFAGANRYTELEGTFPDWQRVVPRATLPALHWLAEDGHAVASVFAASERGTALKLAGDVAQTSQLKLTRSQLVSLKGSYAHVEQSSTIETGVAVSRSFCVGYQAGYIADICETFATFGRAHVARGNKHLGSMLTLSLPDGDSYGPGVWRMFGEAGEDGPFIVIMPMRI